MASTGAAIFFGRCACLLLGAAGACFMVAERRRRKIDRYERLFQDRGGRTARGSASSRLEQYAAEAPSLRGIETELTSRVADPDESSSGDLAADARLDRPSSKS